MEYANRLKGAVTQTLLRSLLEDAGYRIVPLGIEEVIREIKVLDSREYRSLKLPTNLRKLPDFFISDKSVKKACLLEVKYRKRWDARVRKSLGTDLKQQVQEWEPLYVMIFLGKPWGFGDLPSYWMKVVRLSIRKNQLVVITKEGDVLDTWDNVNWSEYSRVQDVFEDVGDQWENQTIEKTKVILRILSRLDEFF